MATLQELLSKKLYTKHLQELTWGEITGVVGGATPQEKAALTQMFAKGQGEQAGRRIQTAVYAKLRADADAEATAMLSDNTLDQAELTRLFG